MKTTSFGLIAAACVAFLPTIPVSAQDANTPTFWQWAQTPPMGWNSYDAYGSSITEEETLANAAYMREHLLPHGWKYVVIDARWYDSTSPTDDREFNKQRTGARLAADSYGRLLPAENRFPSAAGGQGFKPLADKIHAMGLKFGFHIMRGIPRQSTDAKTPIEGSAFNAAEAAKPESKCSWCPDMFGVRATEAGQAWYDSLFCLYAAWGIDFVKVDDLTEPFSGTELDMIRKAIDKCGRPIVFSTSPGPTEVSHANQVCLSANMWRISGDFWDRWQDLNRAFDLFARWQGGGGAGHFPDGDMLPIGHLGIRCTIAGNERQTRFTKDEQLTLLSLWALAPSPLMLGNALVNTDEKTLALITNDEVIAVNQDALARQGRRIVEHLGTEIWIKPLKDGGKAIGLFNRTNETATVALNWNEAQLTGPQILRDLWPHRELGRFEQTFSVPVPAHGAVLLRATPATK